MFSGYKTYAASLVLILLAWAGYFFGLTPADVPADAIPAGADNVVSLKEAIGATVAAFMAAFVRHGITTSVTPPKDE